MPKQVREVMGLRLSERNPLGGNHLREYAEPRGSGGSNRAVLTNDALNEHGKAAIGMFLWLKLLGCKHLSDVLPFLNACSAESTAFAD